MSLQPSYLLSLAERPKLLEPSMLVSNLQTVQSTELKQFVEQFNKCAIDLLIFHPAGRYVLSALLNDIIAELEDIVQDTKESTRAQLRDEFGEKDSDTEELSEDSEMEE